MARHDGDIRRNRAETLETGKALALYLSGDEGWREALSALDGAFASEAAATVRLSGRKAK